MLLQQHKEAVFNDGCLGWKHGIMLGTLQWATIKSVSWARLFLSLTHSLTHGSIHFLSSAKDATHQSDLSCCDKTGGRRRLLLHLLLAPKMSKNIYLMGVSVFFIHPSVQIKRRQKLVTDVPQLNPRLNVSKPLTRHLKYFEILSFNPRNVFFSYDLF